MEATHTLDRLSPRGDDDDQSKDTKSIPCARGLTNHNPNFEISIFYHT